MKCNLGAIIEFQGFLDRATPEQLCDELYVDRVTTICAYDNGTFGYWTAIYPELMGHRSEIKESEIMRVIEQGKGEPIKIPPFPYTRGQKILYSWDEDKAGNVTYLKGKITEMYWTIEDEEPLLRISVEGKNCICMEDEHEIEVLP